MAPATRTAEPPDPAYPRTYRPAPAWRGFCWAFAICLLTISAVTLGGLAGWWPLHIRGPFDAATRAVFCAIGLLGGAYVIAAMRTVRITLYPDAVEVMSYGTPLAMLGLRPPARLERADIARRTVTQNRGGRRMILYARDGRTMRIRLIFRTDAKFRDWFKPIPLTRREQLGQ